MENTLNQKEADQLTRTLIQNCWDDENFKQELISNPVQTIENLKGSPLNISKESKIIVSDQTNASCIYINIPAKPVSLNTELSDTELESIAGGVSRPLSQLNPPSLWDIIKALF